MLYIRLKDILAERGMSQTELANLVGVDKNTISRWATRHRTRVDLDVLGKVCEVLNVTPNDIFVRDLRETSYH